MAFVACIWSVAYGIGWTEEGEGPDWLSGLYGFLMPMVLAMKEGTW